MDIFLPMEVFFYPTYSICDWQPNLLAGEAETCAGRHYTQYRNWTHFPRITGQAKWRSQIQLRDTAKGQRIRQPAEHAYVANPKIAASDQPDVRQNSL